MVLNNKFYFEFKPYSNQLLAFFDTLGYKLLLFLPCFPQIIYHGSLAIGRRPLEKGSKSVT